MRIFQFEDIHYSFKGEFVEVEAIAHIVVRRYGFGVIINHDATIPLLTDGIQCLHATPVKFHRRTDTVRTGTENNNGFTVAQITDIVSNAAIRQVQIIGLCRILCCKGVNLLHHRKDANTLAMVAYIENTVFHISLITNGTGNLEVGEALYFCFFQ